MYLISVTYEEMRELHDLLNQIVTDFPEAEALCRASVEANVPLCRAALDRLRDQVDTADEALAALVGAPPSTLVDAVERYGIRAVCHGSGVCHPFVPASYRAAHIGTCVVGVHVAGWGETVRLVWPGELPELWSTMPAAEVVAIMCRMADALAMPTSYRIEGDDDPAEAYGLAHGLSGDEATDAYDRAQAARHALNALLGPAMAGSIRELAARERMAAAKAEMDGMGIVA